MAMARPAGVTAVALLFLLAAGYLCLLGLLLLFAPDNVSLLWGTFLLGGLALAGPYMFLLAGSVGLLIAWGLLRLNNWARRAAILVALAGAALLLPDVSTAATDLRWLPLFWAGLGIMLRVVVVWYLYQTPVAEQFHL
jgi:hypothetical protein